MAKNNPDIQNFISMQMLFRNKSSHLNFIKTLSGIEELQLHVVDESIATQSDLEELIDDICDTITETNIFGNFKN